MQQTNRRSSLSVTDPDLLRALILWEEAHQKQPPHTSLKAILEGFLFKRGVDSFFQSWKKRYFVLQGPLLYYYSADDGKIGTFRGVICIQNCLVQQITSLDDKEHSFIFEIVPKTTRRPGSSDFTSKNFILASETELSMTRWIKAIQQNSKPKNEAEEEKKATFESFEEEVVLREKPSFWGNQLKSWRRSLEFVLGPTEVPTSPTQEMKQKRASIAITPVITNRARSISSPPKSFFSTPQELDLSFLSHPLEEVPEEDEQLRQIREKRNQERRNSEEKKKIEKEEEERLKRLFEGETSTSNTNNNSNNDDDTILEDGVQLRKLITTKEKLKLERQKRQTIEVSNLKFQQEIQELKNQLAKEQTRPRGMSGSKTPDQLNARRKLVKSPVQPPKPRRSAIEELSIVHQGDEVSARLAAYIKKNSDVKDFLPPDIQRISKGLYVFNKKQVQMTVKEDVVLVRVGGGYCTFEEFIQKYRTRPFSPKAEPNKRLSYSAFM